MWILHLPHHIVKNIVCSVLNGLITWKNHHSVMTVLDILHAKNALQTSSVDGAGMMIIQQLADVCMGILQVSCYQVHVLPHIYLSSVGPLFWFSSLS